MNAAFSQRISEYKRRFHNGQLVLAVADSLRDVLHRYNVPEAYGVYLIATDERDSADVLYIGKSGTMLCDGTFRPQSLRKRLMAKQQGVPREHFYRRVMNEQGIDRLVFRYFVTVSAEQCVIPACAEAELLQAYYDEYGRLPRLNQSF